MAGEPRVTDEDESPFVFEGFGPAGRTAPPQRRRIQELMGRVIRDARDQPDDYGPLRDALVLLAENYGRTCQDEVELTRRLEQEARGSNERAAAARLLHRVWQAIQKQ